MTLQEIQHRNYKATVKRGLINDKTNDYDFINKMYEEILEFSRQIEKTHIRIESTEQFKQLQEDRKKLKLELADIILVCLAYADHSGIDIQSALEEKVKYNECRKD